MYTVRLENLGASKIVFEGTKREAIDKFTLTPYLKILTNE